MFMKSKKAKSYLADLVETFKTLRRFNMCQNMTMCIFKAQSRRFLGFIIHNYFATPLQFTSLDS